MHMLYGFKSIQNRVRIISKVEKVLYSRAFFMSEVALKTF